ncbi:hypothetical protein HHK36_006735 [Tetracentron sinense]|uniref:Gnk2-homologous domain-containing protein n=1 Tax=Tetracentron sinense TaxID=13715 RepID=A0A834ZQB5_TETSI|nr:hypothetical protein HHK36_006735 [Tetracentron sinense]
MPDCARCVARSVSQLGVLCFDSCGGAFQLQGCFVKYDNITFLGVEDKTVVLKKCGPSIGYDSNAMSRRDAMLDGLASGGGPYRVGGSGGVQGVVQCVGDLSVSECQDCVSEAIGHLRSDCGTAVSGDVFLAKCYARYSVGVDNLKATSDSSDEAEKTFAIIIGVFAGVALIIVFLTFLRKAFEGKGEGNEERSKMALEWVVLAYVTGAEAVMVLLLTLPGLDRLRKGLISVTRNLLKPFLSVIPFCMFLLMDIYWKYETEPSCESQSCTPTENLRHQKSIMKSQRNGILIAAALFFYWVLFSVTNLVVRIEQLNQGIEKLKNQD